jgi:molybdopterin-containing oxidoreductase family iron-sulfur binding subunit
MAVDRRKFLKIAGACALGLGTKPAIDVLWRGELQAQQGIPNKGALVGTRWAMVVDVSKCKDNCVDCMQACHSVHNVPDIGTKKEEIKWIWNEPYENAFPDQGDEFLTETARNKNFIILCNHCLNPPCVRVCPTQATYKRKSDGIVMMDMHRCIGCRYCMAACPFGARSFNWREPRPYIKETNMGYPTRGRGVVEKCTFCEERLAVGKIPACVEACKTKCLVFGDLGDPKSEVRELLRTHYTIRRKVHLGTNPNVYYIV